MDNKNIWLDGIMGVVVGDALGLPVQFSSREEVEKELSSTLRQFSLARSVTPSYVAETAFSMPSVAVKAECEVESIMGVDVPKVTLSSEKRTEDLPYAYSEITGEADYSVQKASELLPKMVALA